MPQKKKGNNGADPLLVTQSSGPLLFLSLTLQPFPFLLLASPDPFRRSPVPPAFLGTHTDNVRVDGTADTVLHLCVQLRQLIV